MNESKIQEATGSVAGVKPYYQDDAVTIYHGDCREMDVLGDVLVTDPPYGVNIGGPQVGRNWRRGKGSYGLEKGAYGLYDDTYEEFVATVAPTIARYVLSCKRAAVFVGPHIWELPRATAIGGVYCPSGTGRHRWGFKTFLPVLLYGTAPTLEIGLGAPKANTISSTATAADNGHPCPKPLTWMRWLIDLTSLPGETIVDPFMGSGTTLRAAKDLGRKAIGIEIEEREIAAKRMGQEVLDVAV